MKVLGIESSADDTGVALIEASGSFGPSFRFSVLENEVASQRHAEYGGIYPNLAKKEHIKNLPLLLEKTLPSGGKPDTIAVTVGPGLEPCLWTGITFAQKLSKKWGVPVVAVNHLEGHIMMSMMEDGEFAAFEFPVLALLISGGNTQLVVSKEPMRYEVVGETRDDAAGEAFDKVARMLGLPYPGGPEISRLASSARVQGLPLYSASLPRPMLHEDSLDFSFSGLKTAVLRIVESTEISRFNLNMKQRIAREFEEAVSDVLVGKTLRAVEKYAANTVAVGGGVSANLYIRAKLERALSAAGCKLLMCPPKLSTDNALMIALAGYFHALRKEFTEPEKLQADGKLKLAEKD